MRLNVQTALNPAAAVYSCLVSDLVDIRIRVCGEAIKNISSARLLRAMEYMGCSY